MYHDLTAIFAKLIQIYQCALQFLRSEIWIENRLNLLHQQIFKLPWTHIHAKVILSLYCLYSMTNQNQKYLKDN